MFRQLAQQPPVTSPDEEQLYTRRLPFRTFDYPGEVHPGLRSYPFLAQVRGQHQQQADRQLGGRQQQAKRSGPVHGLGSWRISVPAAV